MTDDGGSDGPTDRDGSTDREGSTAATPTETAPPLGVAVVTVSAERTIETDEPTGEIVRTLEAADHEIAVRERIDSTHDTVQSTVIRLADRDDVDLVITAGATGIEPGDATIEAIRPILDKGLPTFDQLFASRAIEAIGTRAISGRTVAGIVDGVPVFCLPGNPEATRLATDELIEPEASRLIVEARGDGDH